MDVESLDNFFEGFIKPETVMKKLEEFIAYVKNDLGDDMKKSLSNYVGGRKE